MSKNVYIVLFRGINVGGNKIVKMETLRKVLTDAGFGNVATYIQSGNVVLTSEKNEKAVAAEIEKLFEAEFGFASRPSIRSLSVWRQIIDGNPFDKAEAGKQVHALVIDDEPAAAAIDALRAVATTEQIESRDGVIYLYTPDGFGTSKVAAVLDRTLKVPLTARNWNTVLKLQEMAEKVSASG